jgi:Zn-dependent protease with chaperone function
MIRLPGILKVAAVLLAEFLPVYVLFNDPLISGIVTGMVTLYVWLGGYLSLFREGAVRAEKLPNYERTRLENAKNQLVEEVKDISSADISNIKIYLNPGDSELQATAYGANCVSVSRGIFDNTDPLTLNAVLGHEISHTLNLDAEFSRAVFSAILLLCGALSVMSFAFMAVIFLMFLVCSFFCSWLGVVAFRGTTKVVSGIFSLLQKGIVVIYRAVASGLSRAAEYRSDLYSARLGYGLQLAHFLSYAAVESNRQLTLTEALYRTHPATPKRVARLEAYVNDEMHR